MTLHVRAVPPAVRHQRISVPLGAVTVSPSQDTPTRRERRAGMIEARTPTARECGLGPEAAAASDRCRDIIPELLIELA